MSSAAKQNQRAHDIFKLCADEIGIPNASEFTTEAAADAVLGPKIEALYAAFEKKCELHGLHFSDAWEVAMPPYFTAKGWVVNDGVLETGCVEKK